MKQDLSGGRLTFPIKLSCTSLAELVAEPELEVALARALGKSFAKARSVLPSALSTGRGVALQPPHLTNGAGISGEQTATLLKRIRLAIEAAAGAQTLPMPMRWDFSHPDVRKEVPAFARASERFDPAQFDVETGSYQVPSYQGGHVGIRVDSPENGTGGQGNAASATSGKPSPEQIVQQIRDSFPHNDGLPDSDGTHYGIYLTAQGEAVPKLYYLTKEGHLKEILYWRDKDGRRVAIELTPGSYRLINTRGELNGELYRQSQLVGRPKNLDNTTLTVVFLVPDRPAAEGIEEVRVTDPRRVFHPRVTLLRLSAEDMTTASEGSYLASVTIWRRGADGKDFPLFPLAWIYAQLEYGWDIWRWETLPDGNQRRVQELSVPLGEGRAFLDYTWKQEGTYDVQCTVRLRDKEASPRPVTDLRRDKVIKLEIKQAVILAALEQQQATAGPDADPIWAKSAQALIQQYEKRLQTEANPALRRAILDALAKLRTQLLQPVEAGPFPIYAVFTDRRTSQTRPLMLFLAPAPKLDTPAPTSASGKPTVTWLLIDVTYPAFNATYQGSGETHGEAIRAAFETSRTSFQNKYPPGQILVNIEWPEMKRHGLSPWKFSIETESWQRDAFEWLTLGVQALGAVTLAASIVFPPSAIVTGAIVVTMVAGATLSGINIASRVKANNFEWDAQAVADIVNIAASFALAAGTVSRGLAGGISRSIASAEALSFDAPQMAALTSKAATLAKFSRAMLWMGLGGDITNGVMVAAETYRELRDVDAAMSEGVLADYERIYGKEEGRRRWEQERFARILGTLARAAVNGLLIAISIAGARRGLGEVHTTVTTSGFGPDLPPAVRNAATAQDYLAALRAEQHPAGSAGRGWDHGRFPQAPRGAQWQPGDPIDMPSTAGGYPTFDTARGRYWRNRAYFELEARNRGGLVRTPDSQDPIRRLSDSDLQDIRRTGASPPAPNEPGRVVELEHSGVPQRAHDWLIELGFPREEARRLTEVSNPAALLEATPLEHAFFDAAAWRFGSQRADVTGARWQGTVAADIRGQRPLAAMSDATITEIVQRARARSYNFNANDQTRSLRNALRSEINVRGLQVALP